MTAENQPVAEMIDATTELLEEDSISVADVVEDLGHSSMSATLLLPAMAVVSPLSGVPLFSTICGMLIFLIAGQMALGRDHLWLPDWLRRQRVSSDRARKVLGPMRRMARFLDRHTEARVKILLRQPFLTVPRVICALCGLAMPFLELVPFSSSTLGIVVSSLAVAMLTRDGLVMLVALLLLTAAGVGLPYLLT
ncbi:exopolysaccharide biosynthesis protein [Phaeobacter inhibens]|uniref:exopolysaccharide biosynthesis protein n=1 Tax=Phaeobacter inhibens TaxID=221822 RepID=UPI0021A32947|nr:exopolysaccharide biosynthesis protein [Phaeobacter inhibens]UWR91542.1 exopolysaccharide biosynthesis protein [Phaeobacter inhibens]